MKGNALTHTSARAVLRLALSLLLALAALQTSAAFAAAERLMLWEVRGAKATVYLYGSIHVCKPGCFPLDKMVLQRFDTSGEFALELDPERPETREKVMNAALLPPGESLKTKLDAQDRALYSRVLASLGLAEAAVSTFQPWMAGILVTIVSAQQEGYEAANGVDLWLLRRAVKQGKSIVELETVDRQIAALSGGTEAEQIEALKISLGLVQSGRAGDYLRDLVNAWRNGDIQRIGELTQESVPNGSGYAYDLLDRRNLEMSDRIEELLRQGRRVFVAVGAAHMTGANGIPTLLRNRGYKVRQVEGK